MNKLKSFISILIAAVFLVGNLQLHLGNHYCGERLVKTSLMFGAHSLGCGDDETDMSCESIDRSIHQFPVVRKIDCCKDEIAGLFINNEFTKRTSSLLKVDFNVHFQLPEASLALRMPYPEKNFSQPVRPPPIVDRDILTLIQVFII